MNNLLNEETKLKCKEKHKLFEFKLLHFILICKNNE